ncbi:MAG: ATP-binding protein [Proteobacteria bacterium]|nr:ATP-binding protein [Pseudomonadota bacterium]
MSSYEENKLVAAHIIQRLGEGGQPPEFGLQRINVGNESYLNVLEHEYFNALLRQGSSFKLVQGYFGGGKTHFLHCVREIAWRYGFVTALVELSPTECPYDDALKVYQNVASRITTAPETIMTPPAYGIGNLVRKVVDERLKPSQGSPEQARAEVLHWINHTLARAWCESHSYRQAIAGLANAYLMADFRREQRIEAWLLGESIQNSELKDDGIYDQLARSNGFTMLRSLLQMVVAMGLNGTALLFDEVDRNLSVSAKRSHIIGDNLRQVVDLCGRHQLPHTLFMYAVPPEFMRTVVPDYPALYQRLKSPVSLSARSPQAVLIDLEKLDLAPTELLTQLGQKLVSVFEDARDIALNHKLQAENAYALAKACTDAYFEVNHRRLFVKTWVSFLYTQLADGESRLTPEDVNALIWSEQQSLTQHMDAEDAFDDF